MKSELEAEYIVAEKGRKLSRLTAARWSRKRSAAGFVICCCLSRSATVAWSDLAAING